MSGALSTNHGEKSCALTKDQGFVDRTVESGECRVEFESAAVTQRNGRIAGADQ